MNDTVNFDIVLIDEPESSFDNSFTNEIIIGQVKDSVQKSTVFFVTHDHMLGLSSNSNSIVYTTIDDTGAHDICVGDVVGPVLVPTIGAQLKRSDVTLRRTEAGRMVYESRRSYYEDACD